MHTCMVSVIHLATAMPFVYPAGWRLLACSLASLLALAFSHKRAFKQRLAAKVNTHNHKHAQSPQGVILVEFGIIKHFRTDLCWGITWYQKTSSSYTWYFRVLPALVNIWVVLHHCYVRPDHASPVRSFSASPCGEDNKRSESGAGSLSPPLSLAL